MARKKYEGSKRGLLDLLDILVGRVSDSDSTQPGLRKRSWGATVMLFCLIPAYTLVFAVAFQVVYSTVRTPAVVSAQNKNTTTATGKKTRSKSVKIASPLNYIDWPIIALAGGIMLIGVGFALVRREQDLTRALQITGAVAEIKNGTSNLSAATHTALEETLQQSICKVTGGSPTQVAPSDPDDIPIAPIADEWLDRQKKK